MSPKHRVLIIDDDLGLLRLIEIIFRRANYEVYCAEDGAQGLSKVEEVNPDLVILDVMMPDMSGLEVCQKLRSQPATAHLPIIMFSARGQVADKVSGFKAGADDYVPKPVEPEELVARAKALLQRAEYRRAPLPWTIAVVGAKGGVGVTTVAVNVAVVLATQGHSTVLAELRAYHGSVARNLNLAVSQDLDSLLSMEASQIDWKEVSRRLLRHASGLQVLAAPQSLSAHLLTAPHVEALLKALLPEAEYVVLDLPAISGAVERLALEQANRILLVTEPESLSVASAQVDLEIFRAWGLLNRVGLVVTSRIPSATPMTRVELESQLGVPVVATIPPEPQVFHEAARMGVPIVVARPDGPGAVALTKLAEWLAARQPLGAPAF